MEQEKKLERKLSLIKIDGSLKDFKNKDDSFDLIVNFVTTKFKNYKQLQNDMNFLNVVCNIVETLIKSRDKKNKIDKKLYVIKILKHIFGNINEQDEQWYKNQIEFLFESEKIVKFNKSNLEKIYSIGKFALKFFL